MADLSDREEQKIVQERIHECQQNQSNQELNLANLKLSIVPSNVFVLQSLRTLNLRNNDLEYLPKNIDLLNKLEILNLSNNRLRDLPSSLGKMKLLRKLLAANNKLEDIPKELGELYNLEELIIPNNRIKILPPELGELLLLQYFDVANNQLEDVPDEINTHNMPHLTLVNFQGNMLKGLSWNLQCLQDVYPLMLSNDLRKMYVKRSLRIRQRVQERLGELENSIDQKESDSVPIELNPNEAENP